MARTRTVVVVAATLVLLTSVLIPAACTGETETTSTTAAPTTTTIGGATTTIATVTTVLGGAVGACGDCHDDTDTISGRLASWQVSAHGSGEATADAGGRAACSGCHSGGGFSARIAAGETDPAEFDTPFANPSRADCRACHQIHVTFSGADWALETTEPVPLFAFTDATYGGGEGNLCTNCHQPRRDFPAAENGMIIGITEHWGPHHGPQSAMLLGIGGGVEPGTPSSHYTLVEDTCVTCHMGDGQHTFAPDVAACEPCHAGAEDFDINGVQTAVEERVNAIGDALVAAGALNENTEDGHPSEDAIENGLEEDLTRALWIWLYIHHEDGSLGVHNASYTRAMLDVAEDLLGL